MRNYIYHGTRTKMTICTPKGKRVEEHYDGWGYGGYQDSQEDPCLDDYNSDYTGGFGTHMPDYALRSFLLLPPTNLQFNFIFE